MTKTKLPGCHVSFTEEGHIYTHPDGLQTSGVTSVLTRMLFTHKYADVDPTVLEKARQRGTAVHKAVEDYEKHGIIDPNIPLIQDYIALMAQHDLQVEASEYLVAKDYDNIAYCTMCDLVLSDGLADIKTTYALDIDYLSWQLSITAMIFEHQTGRVVERLYGIHLKEGVSKVVDVPRKSAAQVEALLDADRFGAFYIEETPDELVRLADVEGTIIALKERIDRAEEIKKEVLQTIIEKMEAEAVKKWETDRLVITYVAPQERETLDTKTVKESYPEIWEAHKKTTSVKASVRIKLKQ